MRLLIALITFCQLLHEILMEVFYAVKNCRDKKFAA